MYSRVGKLFVACVAVVLVASCRSEDDSDGRIVDGQVITVEKIPYFVRIKHINGDQWCGGSLVTSRHVVTAAHCLDFVDPVKELRIVAGISELKGVGQVRSIASYYKPSTYTRETFNDDYAVLRLSSPFKLGRTVKPIQLSSATLAVGNSARVSGFGRQVGGGDVSSHLRTTLTSVISDTTCSKTFRLSRSMFCTAASGTGPCQYDSGGPLVCGTELCGIVSWGRSDCNYSKGSPAVFTSIKAVAAEIRKQLF